MKFYLSSTVGLLTLIAFLALSATPWTQGGTNVAVSPGDRDPIDHSFIAAQVEAIVNSSSQKLGTTSEGRTKVEDEMARLTGQLGFSREAVIGFFHILDDQDVPLEQMPQQLVEISKGYRALLAQLGNVRSTNSEVQKLEEQAHQALEKGDFARTEELLNQAMKRDLSMIEPREADRNLHTLSAAQAAAENGDLMMIQLRYAKAAGYYAEVRQTHAEEFRRATFPAFDALGRGGLACRRLFGGC